MYSLHSDALQVKRPNAQHVELTLVTVEVSR